MLVDLTLQNVLVLLTIQFAIFGWRINREIPVGEQGRRVWFPVADAMNVLSMLLVLYYCVVSPLVLKASSPAAGATSGLPASARTVFALALVLVVFHPISMIAHYGLLNEHGRDGFLKTKGDDYPYWPLQERVVNIIAILAASAAAWCVGNL